jgi:XTP/dITP diphosphohydrolase
VKLAVVTGNPHKAREVAAYLEGILEVEHVVLECPEFRGSDVGEIARGKARYAFERLNRPLIVDDTAFCIDSLNGFPGPYAAYVLDTLGITGILTLMEGIKRREARFVTAIAYADNSGIRVFKGTVEGRIVAPRGSGGFGYDPIFEVKGRTFSELSLAEKSELSHRGRALAAFASWLKEERIPYGQKG